MMETDYIYWIESMGGALIMTTLIVIVIMLLHYAFMAPEGKDEGEGNGD